MQTEKELESFLIGDSASALNPVKRAEFNILAAFIMDPHHAKNIIELTEEHFRQGETKEIYKAIKSLYSEDKAISYLTVAERVMNKIPHAAVFLSKLVTLWDPVPFEQNFEILETSRKKRLANSAISEAQRKIYDGSFDIDSITNEMIEKLAAIHLNHSLEDDPGLRTGRTLKYIASVDSSDRYRWYTGLYELDNLLGGIYRGDLTVIGADSGGGKTALGMQIAEKLGSNKLKGLYVSREMNETRLDIRMISSMTGINSRKIKDNDLDSDEMSRVVKALNEISKKTLIIADNIANINQIKYRLKKEPKDSKFDFVVVDYIQIMDAASGSSREQQVASITRDLKKLSLDFNIAVIALTQLNEEGKARESRSIFFDADNYIRIINPTGEQWEKIFAEDLTSSLDLSFLLAVREIGNDLVQISVDKQRDGGLGRFICMHVKQEIRFKSLKTEQIMIPIADVRGERIFND